ncbi:MAG: hypothetical protein ACPG49_13330 [Chitinophagales bacterium]
MKKLILTILLLCLVDLTMGQSIKASFPMRALPDNLWQLELYKDNTYKYVHWSGFGGSTTLDYGQYSLSNTKLHLDSKIRNNEKGLPLSDYFVEIVKLKKYQSIWTTIAKDEKPSLFGKKFLVLTETPFDYSKTISQRPADNILVDTLPSETSFEDWINFEDWIKKTTLRLYGYSSIDKLPDSCWSELHNDDKVKIVTIINEWDLFRIFYQVDQQVYSTRFDRDLECQKAIIDKLTKEGKLTKQNSKKILNLIEEKINKTTANKVYSQ